MGAAGALYLARPKANTGADVNTSGIEHARAEGSTDNNPQDLPLPVRKPIVITQTQELLTTDPTDSDYDPSMLMRVNQADASKLYELEMRAEDWASDFEDHMQQHVRVSLSDILVDIPVAVECRTATCKISIDISSLGESETKAISDYLSHVAPVGPMTQIGTSGNVQGYLTIFSALSSEFRTKDGFSGFAADFAEGGGERLEAQKKLLIEKMQPDETL